MSKFNEKYNRENFSSFLREFLPPSYKEREQQIKMTDRYKVITEACVLGECEELDNLHVLEMTHNRKNPKVEITRDAFRILTDHWIHHALVIFKNDDSDTYRFSCITLSIDEDEKGKIVRKYSNPRRYSFLLGVGAKTKTPQQQLKESIKDFDDLLSRFSLEVVNKEFYKGVSDHFEKLIQGDLKTPSSDGEDVTKFAIRLIGRIMFCWFLKQKNRKGTINTR